MGEGHSEAEDEFIHEDEAVGGRGVTMSVTIHWAKEERDHPLGEARA